MQALLLGRVGQGHVGGLVEFGLERPEKLLDGCHINAEMFQCGRCAVDAVDEVVQLLAAFIGKCSF